MEESLRTSSDPLGSLDGGQRDAIRMLFREFRTSSRYACTLPQPSDPSTIRCAGRWADPPRLRVEVDGKPLSSLRSGQFEEYAAPWVVSRDTVYDRDNRYDAPLPVLPALLEPGVREAWQSMVTTDPKERPRRWHVQIDALSQFHFN